MSHVDYELHGLRCDVCQALSAPVIKRVSESYAMPEGWAKRTLTNCGMTGYSRTDHLCPKCSSSPTTENT
mgnify:CR=1 FL=1